MYLELLEMFFGGTSIRNGRGGVRFCSTLQNKKVSIL